MKLFEKLVSHVKTGIDRIQFSLPIGLLQLILSGMDLYCELTRKGKFKGYRYKTYYYSGCKILIAYKDITDKKNKNSKAWDRFFLTISDANNTAQELLNFIFTTAEGEKYTYFDITINQLEIAYDIYPTDNTEVSEIKDFLVQHIFMKRSRFNSYYTYKDTFYIGNDGNVRNGIKGIRLYEKTENGETFYRLEVQFNRRYLKDINLLYKDLPVSPMSFHGLSFVELRDTFSDKGVFNVARSILRKLGITPSSADFDKLHADMILDVRKEIRGGSRGKKRRSSSQIGCAKKLKKTHKLSVDVMQYFHHMHFEKQLLSCHAAVGCAQENSSNRMIFCESAEEE